MARSKKKTGSKKKKPARFFSVGRLVVVFLLTVMVLLSVFAAGYVIFFRTVFAQDIPSGVSNGFIFEEPDPPVHEEQVAEGAEERRVRQEELPMVAIIIDDLGYHQQVGDQLLNFTLELTYSFLPFAPFTREQESMAFYAGKTVLLHLPLEPKDLQWDSGPGTLLLKDSPEMQREKFEQDLAAVPHAVGVNNHMGSRYTEDRDAMKRLLRFFDFDSLFFVDSFTTAASVGQQVAKEIGIKTARRNVFLDNKLDLNNICEQLETLVDLAEKKGQAIGIGHPHQVTADALLKCTGKYSSRVQYVSIIRLL
ncbi:MAG: divergent polysaccharide deacetylase family protein [Deltaproteobacteria bacterium]|nr:divergent polysaccharide deacetylase family protein [Deltaproteobacteria bacterium]